MKIKQKIKAFVKKFKFARKLWHFYQKIIYIFKSSSHSAVRKKQRQGYIVQLLPTFSMHDAIGNAVYEISKELTKRKIENYIVYEGAHSKINNGVPVGFFRFNADDTVIYHMAGGSKSSKVFKDIKVKNKIMNYHNITPAEFFYDTPADKKIVTLGREQLIMLKDCVDLAICDSKYNEQELKELGYKNTCVVPIPHRVEDLLKHKVEKENDGITKLITVGRLARNKCIQDVIKVFDEYNKINPKSKLYIVGRCTNLKYEKELKKLVKDLNIIDSVVFAGGVNEEQLGHYYSNADAYICMSEHEGYCVPLIEARAFHVPVFAYNTCAIPETLDGFGFLFDNKNPYIIACKIDAVLRDEFGKKNIDTFSFNVVENVDIFLSKISLR